ncbi:hypothetical protein ACFWPY_08025 [Streptomyces sp. NPDC058527]|uniref:hypothetical protein n=1 Tax=unclassified Streptomyces TaxID=2593676 RepID=UPI00366431AE
MTLDAQDWVWQHSRTRGNARLVMLAIADAITGPDALASMGTAEIMQRLNVSRSTARAAVDAALASDELVEDEPAKGSRATRYKIPGAVNYVRRYRGTGPKSGPIAPQAHGPESGPLTATGPKSGPSTGPESGPPVQDPAPLFGTEIRPPMGPESGPHHSPIDGVNEGGRGEYRAEVATIPAKARPLVDQITAAGVLVAWTLAPGEWLVVDALMKRSGADMLAQAAVQAAHRARKGVAHARYFLRGWQALPPAPEPGTIPATAPAGPARSNVIPLDRSQPRGRVAQSADYLAEALAAMEAQQ